MVLTHRDLNLGFVRVEGVLSPPPLAPTKDECQARGWDMWLATFLISRGSLWWEQHPHEMPLHVPQDSIVESLYTALKESSAVPEPLFHL